MCVASCWWPGREGPDYAETLHLKIGLIGL